MNLLDPSGSAALSAPVRRLWKETRLPFLSAVLIGLTAHAYAFSNKLLNHDEIESLFGKGATVTSGRWGLELVKIIFPDWSMPWIYGILSLLLVAAAACLMLRILEIRSAALQIVLSGMVVSFPSLTGNFCFMFTSAPYALSFFLTVLAVYLFRKGGFPRMAAAFLLLVFALGIYQAYIAVAATLFVLIMISETMDAERPVREILLDGIRALVFLAAAIAVYYCTALLVLRFTGEAFNAYVTENVNAQLSLPRRIRAAYDAFSYIFRYRNFSLITSEFSRWLHIILCVLTLAAMGTIAIRNRKALHAALLLALLLLLPLSVCCMFLVMAQDAIHTLVMYGFVCIYFCMGIAAEKLTGGREEGACRPLALALALIVLGNIYFANKCYLRQQLEYENAYAFYTVLATRVCQTEGFDADCRLALIGRQDNLLYAFPEIDTEGFLGVDRDLVNVYSRENLLRYYLGFDIPFAQEEELQKLEEDPRVQEMPEYPYFGSVRKIGSCIVVRLG